MTSKALAVKKTPLSPWGAFLEAKKAPKRGHAAIKK